ncbi:MAG: ArsA family ATPase [Pseudobdellovibrionaceae bacterium]
MKSLIENSRVLVCVGSGGVGKTTVASSLALLGAQMGKRVLVLTVDPAQRLKTTMGIEEGQEAVEIKGHQITGQLFASVIDPKKTFDEFVMRAASQPERVKKILNNKLYVQLSTTLSGSQEFTALEKLYSSFESGKYDLIVLDTPPTKHAIDFLEAPQKLAALFTEGVAKWFRDPQGTQQNFFIGLLQTGTRQVLKALETLTGSDFMRELAEFFQNIEQWQGQLEKRAGDVHSLLVSPTTNFVLVTSFDEAKLKEAEYFSKEIKKGGYRLAALIINRAFPFWIQSEEELKSKSPPVLSLFKQMKDYYQNREESFSRFSIRMNQQAKILRLPEMREDVSDIAGVELLANYIKEAK